MVDQHRSSQHHVSKVVDLSSPSHSTFLLLSNTATISWGEDLHFAVSLKSFFRYPHHATWSVIGLLAFKSKKNLFSNLPSSLSRDLDPSLNLCSHIPFIGENEASHPSYFASSIVSPIASTPGMEVASRSFRHFYCIEPNAAATSFASDLEASVNVLYRFAPPPKSIVFFRKQYSHSSIEVARKAVFTAFRGNALSILFRPRSGSFHHHFIRDCRLLDSYLPLSDNNCLAPMSHSGITTLRASPFLRPIASTPLDKFFLQQSTASMTACASSKHGFHFWFYPHDVRVHIHLSLYCPDQTLSSFI